MAKTIAVTEQTSTGLQQLKTQPARLVEFLKDVRSEMRKRFKLNNEKVKVEPRQKVQPYLTRMTEWNATELLQVGERMQANHGIPFEHTPAVVDAIAGRCKEVESGARNVDQIITGTLLPSIAHEMLKRMAEGKAVDRVKVDVGPEGAFTFSFGAA